MENDLILNLHKLHTTVMGVDRITVNAHSYTIITAHINN